MTIGEAIEIIDRTQPNQIEVTEKVRWLSELDGKIFHEIMVPHRGFEWVKYKPYAPDVPQEHQLLVPHPYDALYPDYLEMRIADENRETYQYNNAMQKYNAKLQEYMDFVNRNFPSRNMRSFRLW